MTTEEHGESSRPDDLPKIVASIIATIPPMLLKIGLKYLAMKRRVRKGARAIEAELKASGMPEHLAHRISIRYEEDSRFLEMILKGFVNKGSLKSLARFADSRTGN